ncbi:nucleolar protein 7 [Gadus chalcogrammus]|uniref:nucleolar protein 7 n=1 Tax=Gadus chalcogrammus TaxID=1042646 RepID=UPI0024C4B6D7|nr:nucleolar protein 7 [Gadus chalcogrammus]
MSEEFSLALDPSEDEAPEEVPLETSRAAAQRSRAAAVESTRREKLQLKEKRRKRHELFQEQKKRRLLPDDVLEEIEAAPPQKKKPNEDEGEEESEEESDDEGVGSGEEIDASGKIRNLQGGYTVKLVNELTLAAAQQRAAAGFVQDRLYGLGSRRTTNKAILSLKNKGPKKAPSVEFVRKNWAPKHKAKAERMKQRWLHRKQAVSS